MKIVRDLKNENYGYETIKNNAGMSWGNVKLDNICTMLSGNAWAASKFKDSGFIPIIRIQNLGNNVNEKFIWWDDKYDKKFVVKKGDLLLSLSGSIKIDTWKSDDALLNQRIVKLIPHKDVEARFFYWQITNIILDIERMGKWALVNNVSITDLKDIQIPLPPLPIQKRIAEILDAADALKRKDQELLKKYDELAQAIFIDMFGDFSEKENTTCLLSDISEITNGVTKNGKLEFSEMMEAPYLRVANVQDGFLDLSEIKFIKVKLSDYEKYQLRKSDILLTEGGDPDKLGRGTTWNEEIPNCIFQNHLFRIRVNNNSIRPFFLAKLIGSKYGKKYFLKAAKQTTGIATINSSQLKAFPVIIPPIAKQIKYETICIQLNNGINKVQLGFDNSENLFQTLIQKAFKGELVQ